MNKNISTTEMDEIMKVLRDNLGVYIIQSKSKIVVSHSGSLTDVLFNCDLTSMDWSYSSSIVGVLDWLSRGIVLYRWVQEDNPEICHAEKYAEIPKFECLSELKMKLNLRGII
jgi:hypothetical protein